MKNGKTAIVLGGTNPHIALINNLKNRGYHTILVDYYENPPAKQYADEHIQESTLDKEKVLEIAKKVKADLVISTSIDQANVTACYVGEQLGLPIPYSYDTAIAVTNKILMKEIMLKNEIPTSKFLKVRSIAECEGTDLTFPLVVKPADTTGSKGVRKVNNRKELETYLNEALQISRNKQAVVEEFVSGIEIQVDFLVENGKVNLIMTREKQKLNNDKDDFVLQALGSLVPASLSDKAEANIQLVAEQIVQSFKLNNTPFFIQAIVEGDNINVIEFACRTGGGLSFSMIKIITKFDILDATINSYLKIPVGVKSIIPNGCYATYLLYTEAGIFDRIEGFEYLLNSGLIEQFYTFKTKGMSVGANMTSGDRVGAFLVKADNRQELNKKINLAIENLEVYDTDGNEILKKYKDDFKRSKDY